MTLTRIPPQDPDAERAVLGAVLLNPDAWPRAAEILPADGSAFFVDAHRVIWTACSALRDAHEPLDVVTLAEALGTQREAIGGLHYLSGLTDAVPTSANVGYYAKIVRELAAKRDLIALFERYSQAGFDPETKSTGLCEAFDREYSAFRGAVDTGGTVHVEHAVEDAVREVEAAINRTGDRAIPMGIAGVEKYAWGWRPGLAFIAARPSVGKTALAMQFALHAARNGHPALFVSLEMSHDSLGKRLASHVAGVNWDRVHNGWQLSTEADKTRRAMCDITGVPLWIDDSPKLTVQQLCRRVESMVRQHGVRIVFVDYLQRLRMGGKRAYDKRHLEVGEMTGDLKALSLTLGVPVVCLCQFNRDADGVQDVFGLLKCLKESGDIEQDADQILGLIRYSPDEAESLRKRKKNTMDYENIVMCGVIKHRNGPTGKVALRFDREMQRFYEVDESGTAVTPPPRNPIITTVPPEAPWKETQIEITEEDSDEPF